MNPMLWRLCWISFLSDISSEFLYPILPLFLTATLGAGMGAVGLIEGCAELAASLLKARMGVWSDRVGRRKPFIAFGYGLSTISKGAIGLASGWGWVLFARVSDRVGKGVRTAPRDALLTASVLPERLGFAFGVHRLMDTAGAVIGPLLAVLLLSLGFEDLRKYFVIALIPGALAVALTFWIHDARAAGKDEARPQLLRGFRELPREYHRYLLAWGLFTIGNSSDAFILLRMKAAGLSTVTMILVYCGFNAVYAGLSLAFGRLSDRVGQKRVLQGALVVFAASYAIFSVAGSIAAFVAGYLLYGVYMAMSEGVSKAFVGQFVPPEEQGSAQGYFGLVTGVCAFTASLAAGLLWERFGPAAPFMLGAAAAVLGSLALSRAGSIGDK